MKKSNEDKHRISNLKDMLNNVKDENKNESIDDAEDIFDIKDDKVYEEDEELLAYLHEDENYEINDEFIYHPKDDSTQETLEKKEINEDFIIKTKLEDIEFSKEADDSIDGEISESFDNLVNAEIAGTPLIGIASLAIGILLIIGSFVLLASAGERVIDNVSSGEHNSVVVFLLIIGILLIIIGGYKVFGLKHVNKLANSIKNIEKEEKPKKEVEKKVIPKSNIPLYKESYKIKDEAEKLDDIPPAKPRSEEKKGLSQKEIEELEYRKASLDGESINEIFSNVEEIDIKSKKDK